MSVRISAVPIVQFEGSKKKKQKKSPESEALQNLLIKQGYDAKYLKKEWGVTLWKLRDKGGKNVRVNVDAGKPLDIRQFTEWLKQALSTKKVEVSVKPLKKCCGSGCKGCLAYKGNPEQRKQWIS